MSETDALDARIIGQLRANARISNARLAEAVGLSQSACLRRVRALETRGVIRGYTVLLDTRHARGDLVAFVQVSLERTTEEFMARFERAVRRCPEVRECYLMSGSSDYQLKLALQDMTDYERVHRDVLSALPGVSRLRSSFSIRPVLHAG